MGDMADFSNEYQEQTVTDRDNRFNMSLEEQYEAGLVDEAGVETWGSGNNRASSYPSKPVNKKEQKVNLKWVEQLLKNLSLLSVPAELFKAAHSGSCYIHFEDPRMGKCRVGGHNERERYAYRWQIRTDIEKPYEDSSKGHRQFFFPATTGGLEQAANRMRQYYSTILRSVN